MELSVRPSLVGLSVAQMRDTMQEAGLPAFRGTQVAEWLYRRIGPKEGGGANASYTHMTDLPVALRETLAGQFSLSPLVAESEQTDTRDGTVKVLARTEHGGNPIECVLLPDSSHVSVCLSTQAGCPMACAFCATGTQGLTRNLSAGEIVGQFLLLQARSARRISHVVLMGMGEPLLNYDNVVAAVRILTSECGLSARHITLSTVGIVPNMERLAREGLPVTLAVSLHAPTNDLRTRLVPVNKTYPLERLMPACRSYARETGRRVTFEYVLLRGVNDRPEDARALATLLRETPGAVNIIPYNPTTVAESFGRPDTARIASFRRILENAGVTVTQRKERGQQIAAACGQLVTEAARARPMRQSLPVLNEPALAGAV